MIKQSVSPRAHRDAANSPWLSLTDTRYVVENLGDKVSKIVGRVSGNSVGAYWYQFAAQPYDKLAVVGFESLESAFAAMQIEYTRRH
jgi:hypothetical protein